MSLEDFEFKPKIRYIKDYLKNDVENLENKNCFIKGWVKTIRKQNELSFISINDGSTIKSIQCIYNGNKSDLANISTGSSLELVGKFVLPPKNSKEKIECIISEFKYIGKILNPETYILSKKGRVKTDVLRKYQHIRPKTNLFASIFRIRSNLSFAVHQFFNKAGFYHLDPNVITTSDCEGAGEVFKITNFDLSKVPFKNNKVDYTKDFFKKKAYLTVSSQLQLEALSSGLGNCYTTNPSFRAEKSNTSRHLSCFNHVEYEMSFCDIYELMDLSEKLVKYCIKYILDNNTNDLENLNKYYTKGLLSRLNSYISKKFKRITYTKAILIIEDEIKSKKLKIKDKPVWGDDLGSVCEKHLAENVFKSPIMVYNYPKKLKSFYMKTNRECVDGRETVQAMDLLVPHIGELIGSSVREDDYDILLSNLEKKNINKEPLLWYLDLRKNGTWRHAGAGLGFERLIGMMCMDSSNFNIRDCLPFPTAYKECNY